MGVAALTETAWKGAAVFAFLCALTALLAALEWLSIRDEIRRELERKEAQLARLKEQLEDWRLHSAFRHPKSSALAVLEKRVRQTEEEIAEVRRRPQLRKRR